MMQHHDHGPNEIPHHPDAVMEPELLEFESREWKPMADMKVDRLYHANALLLPDGRVMTAGSNPDRNSQELRIEIFRPPYLFRGKRPIIKKSDEETSYNKTMEIETLDSETIDKICIIRPTCTTHCVNPEQRYIGLEFERQNDTILQASLPRNANLAPPGYYMLFILNSKDVPSIATL